MDHSKEKINKEFIYISKSQLSQHILLVRLYNMLFNYYLYNILILHP